MEITKLLTLIYLIEFNAKQQFRIVQISSMAVSKLLEISIILSDNVLKLKNIKIYTNFTSTFKLCIHSKQMDPWFKCISWYNSNRQKKNIILWDKQL